MSTRAIDLWVNVSMGAMVDTEFMVRVKEDYFKGGEDFFKNLTSDETIEAMDKAGVEKCLLTLDPEAADERTLAFCQDHPGRFFLALAPTHLRSPAVVAVTHNVPEVAQHGPAARAGQPAHSPGPNPR